MPNDYLTLSPESLCRLVSRWTDQPYAHDDPRDLLAAAETLTRLCEDRDTQHALATMLARDQRPESDVDEPPVALQLVTLPSPAGDTGWMDDPTEASLAAGIGNVVRGFNVRKVRAG